MPTNYELVKGVYNQFYGISTEQEYYSKKLLGLFHLCFYNILFILDLYFNNYYSRLQMNPESNLTDSPLTKNKLIMSYRKKLPKLTI